MSEKMTREEAIQILQHCKIFRMWNTEKEDKEALNMAISALQTQRHGEERITRKQATMYARPEYLNPKDDYAKGWNKAIDEYMLNLETIPAEPFDCGAKMTANDSKQENHGSEVKR